MFWHVIYVRASRMQQSEIVEPLFATQDLLLHRARKTGSSRKIGEELEKAIAEYVKKKN
jgi:hypothetical protein